MKPTQEQQKILDSDKKNLIVSASAGSGKTFIVVEQIINLICKKNLPVSKLLVLTFTKAAAGEMKSRLYKAILNQKSTPFLREQLDDISISDISTIDAFCEKIIKRHINKLNIDENFRVLDEKESKNLKMQAFNHIFDRVGSDESMSDIYFAFKNKEQILECLLYIQNYLSSQDNCALESFIQDYDNKYKQSLSYLNSVLQAIRLRAKENLKFVDNNNLPQPYQEFFMQVNNICNFKLSEDFFENCKVINNLVYPSLPRVKFEDVLTKRALTNARDILKEMQAFSLEYEDVTEEEQAQLKEGKLAKQLLNLFKVFQEEYKLLKQKIGGLDFADLEREVKGLLEDDEVLRSLQTSYDYIFIDEYQDTNALQEAIIKAIAKTGHFVAVGDPKQGIYGFRNASKEIMQKDIADFSSQEDGEALYLTGNFRSDNRILSFVNHVFDKIMTEDSVGIDYKNTSELKGLVEFKKDSLPSVRVDVVLPSQEEKLAEGVYSVKNDSIDKSYKYKDEVVTLANRIEELLESQIYDAKLEQFRKVLFSDIAVLFRGRSSLMEESVRYLQEKGFSCIADLKQSLLEDSQIQVLLSLLKLVINFKDDVSLVSVMNSYLGGFTIDELSQFRIDSERDYFWQIVSESKEEKVLKFIEIIKEFEFNSFSLGITKAFNILFNKTNYYCFINGLPDKNVKLFHLQEFFKLIKQTGDDYNISALLEQIENVDSASPVVSSAINAITITTIHATKGLEFPIVILAGSGEKLKKVYNKAYNISAKFGLGTYLYNFHNNTKRTSPIFLANKQYQKSREFIDELMIFYVALTRAQNHLYIIGSDSEGNLIKNKELSKCDSYLDLIFFSFGENFKIQFLEQEQIDSENYSFNLITQTEEAGFEEVEEDFNKNIALKIDGIKDYIDFHYNGIEFCNVGYKNSVSSIMNLEEHQYSGTDEKVASREGAINKGNAYHLALKLLDFNNIYDNLSLEKELLRINSSFNEGEIELIDKNILLKNILLIKSVAKGKLYKEKEFIMQSTIKEILGKNSNNEIIVQGIIDLFSLGGENVLIDYKFTSISDENLLLERYKKQLELYSLALEKGFDIKLDKIYLLSLGQAKLIENKR